LRHWSIAFVCAVEPEPFSEPVEQAMSPLPELLFDEVLPPAGGVLPPLPPELLQAPSASALAANRPSASPVRLSCTFVPFVGIVSTRTLGARYGGTGVQR